MRKLTAFGKQLRIILLDKAIRLGEMAHGLGCSSSYLSSVEAGRRPVPKHWPQRIGQILDLSNAETETLARLATEATSRTNGRVSIVLNELTPLQQDIALLLATNLKTMDDADLRRLLGQLAQQPRDAEAVPTGLSESDRAQSARSDVGFGTKGTFR